MVGAWRQPLAPVRFWPVPWPRLGLLSPRAAGGLIACIQDALDPDRPCLDSVVADDAYVHDIQSWAVERVMGAIEFLMLLFTAEPLQHRETAGNPKENP